MSNFSDSGLSAVTEYVFRLSAVQMMPLFIRIAPGFTVST
jgi:hypothetical protein